MENIISAALSSKEEKIDDINWLVSLYEDLLPADLYTSETTVDDLSLIGVVINKIEELLPGDIAIFKSKGDNVDLSGIYTGQEVLYVSPVTRSIKGIKFDEYWTKKFYHGIRLSTNEEDCIEIDSAILTISNKGKILRTKDTRFNIKSLTINIE